MRFVLLSLPKVYTPKIDLLATDTTAMVNSALKIYHLPFLAAHLTCKRNVGTGNSTFSCMELKKKKENKKPFI